MSERITARPAIPALPAPAATLDGRLFRPLVAKFLSRIRRGALELVLPDGERMRFGDPHDFAARIEVRNERLFRRIVLAGDIGFGEAYTDGDWDSPDLTAVLAVFCNNMDNVDDRGLLPARIARAVNRVRHLANRNSIAGSRANIHAHYDLGNAFYGLFLDPTMTYSCALFRSAEESLEQGQMNKIRALIDKAHIQPGHHVLEIGSGWGALAIEAVRRTKCRVTTITLSEEQFRHVRDRVAAEGLGDRIEPLICDYREMKGRFDRVISCEMIEAVGHEYHGAYFAAIDRLLAPGGIATIQAITLPDQRYDAYRRGCDWIQKYIFPGAVCPSVSRLAEAMASHSRLCIEHAENIGIHYARTLREWRERFLERKAEVLALGFDERFCRIWDYYLCYCEAGFATRQLGVYHMVLSRPNNAELPVY